MATSSSSTNSNATITNYHDIYVQQTNITNNRNNDSELDRIEQMSTNPTPPPSYNQLPSTVTAGISSHDSNSRLVMVSSERYQLPGTSSSRVGSTGNVIIVHGSSGSGGAVSSSSGGRRGDPPSYEDAINREEPPPSYDSLFGRVREAHKSSTGMMDFLKNVVILLLGTHSLAEATDLLKRKRVATKPLKLQTDSDDVFTQSIQMKPKKKVNKLALQRTAKYQNELYLSEYISPHSASRTIDYEKNPLSISRSAAQDENELNQNVSRKSSTASSNESDRLDLSPSLLNLTPTVTPTVTPTDDRLSWVHSSKRQFHKTKQMSFLEQAKKVASDASTPTSSVTSMSDFMQRTTAESSVPCTPRQAKKAVKRLSYPQKETSTKSNYVRSQEHLPSPATPPTAANVSQQRSYTTPFLVQEVSPQIRFRPQSDTSIDEVIVPETPMKTDTRKSDHVNTSTGCKDCSNLTQQLTEAKKKIQILSNLNLNLQVEKARLMRQSNDQPVFINKAADWMDPEVVMQIHQECIIGPAGDGRFISTVADHLWTKAQIASRSVRGKNCNLHPEKGSNLQATPSKVSYIFEKLVQRVDLEGDMEGKRKIPSRVSKKLNEKFSNSRRKNPGC